MKPLFDPSLALHDLPLPEATRIRALMILFVVLEVVLKMPVKWTEALSKSKESFSGPQYVI